MTRKQWLTCADLEKMLAFVDGKATDRKLRLFAIACVRTVWGAVPGGPTRQAVKLAEEMADGQADLTQRRQLIRELVPAVRDQLEVFRCGGSEGSGAIFASMAATATLDDSLRFTATEESNAVWTWVAMVRAQPAAEKVRKKRVRGDIEVDPDDDTWYDETQRLLTAAWDTQMTTAQAAQCELLREILSPFTRRISNRATLLTWRDRTIPKLAQAAYDDRELPSGHLDTKRLAILADALEESGCTNEDMLSHLRGPGPHVRGCWVVDLLLGKE